MRRRLLHLPLAAILPKLLVLRKFAVLPSPKALGNLEVTKAGAAMDGRDSRKGPAQGIRYRSGMPPAPATRHYSRDDLRAYDRWEKRVRIWEMQVAS